MDNEASLTVKTEWSDLSAEEQNMALEIVKSIKETHTKIQNSREKAKQIEKEKGLFKGAKRDQILADALIETNQVVDELAKIQQEAIRLTCTSAKMAQKMIAALAYISANGISDANGQIETLAEEQIKSIDTIIKAADDYNIQQTERDEEILELRKSIEICNRKAFTAIIFGAAGIGAAVLFWLLLLLR